MSILYSFIILLTYSLRTEALASIGPMDILSTYILSSTSRPTTSTKPTTYLSSTTCIGHTFDLSHVCLPAHGEQMILSDYECFVVFWLGVQV